MTKNKIEKKNEIIIQKLSNVLEELEFLNYNCPREVGLKDCYTVCDSDSNCVECWIEALRKEKEKMSNEKSCNNCKYEKRTETRDKHGKLIAFSSECTLMRVCINREYWKEEVGCKDE